MTNEAKRCLFCNEILKGRSDKRFCNANCRASYHNQNTNNQEFYIKEVNKQLRKNRSALKRACPWGKATVRKSFLAKLGMDFKHFTHTWRSQHNNLYLFCYDYGYMYIDDPEKVLIIQEQDYMKPQ